MTWSYQLKKSQEKESRKQKHVHPSQTPQNHNSGYQLHLIELFFILFYNKKYIIKFTINSILNDKNQYKFIIKEWT
jgi:hypothetical protein